MLSAYLCLQQFMTTIHVINTFVRLIVSARYICIAFQFPQSNSLAVMVNSLHGLA